MLSAAVLRRRLLLAPLVEHRGRSLLSILAIALGVALGYAVQLINQVAVNEFSHAVQSLSGQADLQIRGPRAGFDESLFPVVAQMPEVAVASPVLELDVRLPDRREPLKLIGLDAFRAARVQPELVISTDAEPLDFIRPDRMFLSQPAADWLGLKAGDELGVQVGLAEVKYRIAGVVRGDGLKQRVGIIDIAGAQSRLARLGILNRIDLRLRPGADVDAFAARIQAQMPAGVLIERPAANVERSATMSRAYRVNLNVLALVALFTGGMLVFSTQALAVVQRRTQLALLRVLGMTARQIFRLLLLEALLVGGIGALAGLALGHVGADLVIGRFGADLGAGQFHGLQPQVRIDLAGMLLFAALGLATALAGSLAPAVEAARASASQALKAGDEQRMFQQLQPVLPGLIVLLLACLLTQGPPVDGLPIFGYVAIACFLVGTIMLMPRLAVLYFRLVQRLVKRGAPAQLAVSQLSGAPGQAMVSLAAIVASVSLMVSMAIMVTSFRASLEDWLERLLPADIYMRTGLQNEAAFLSVEDQERIRAAAGVRRAEFLRVQQLLLAPERPPVLLLARAIDRNDPESAIPLVGDRAAIAPAGPPPIWPSEAMVDLYGYRVGQVVALPLAGKSMLFLVAGIWRDYARQQGSIVMEREVYVRLTGDAKVNDGAVWMVEGAQAADVKVAIRASLAGGPNLELGEPGQIRTSTLHIFDRTFAVTYGLEAVAVVIGLFGLSSSFGALVLARKREFGMLRHVGMTRRQVGAMLAIEGALVSALGMATGIALGWLISMVLIHVVNRQSFHWSMELHLPWLTLFEFVVVMTAMAVLTALASGRRAMGADAVRAVREDW